MRFKNNKNQISLQLQSLAESSQNTILSRGRKMIFFKVRKVKKEMKQLDLLKEYCDATR
jgi:hypothetical protein